MGSLDALRIINLKEVTMHQHYFSSSVAEWRVSTDLKKLTEDMKKSGFEFTLWRLPVSIDADYEIKYFVPQVEGREYLGKVSIKD